MSARVFFIAVLSYLMCACAFCQAAHAGTGGPSELGTVLETALEMRHFYFENRRGRQESSWQAALSVGLGWTPVSWLSVHGAVGVIWGAALGDPFKYGYRKQMLETSCMGGFGVRAALGLHLPSRLLGVEGALDARALMIPHRSGLFEFSGGVGLVARPFCGARGTLRLVSFALCAWFPIYSDLERAFDIRYGRAVLGMRVDLGF